MFTGCAFGGAILVPQKQLAESSLPTWGRGSILKSVARRSYAGGWRPSTAGWKNGAAFVAPLALVMFGACDRRHERLRRRTARRATDATAVKETLAKKEAEYRQRQRQSRGSPSAHEIPALGSIERTSFVGDDGMLQVPKPEKGVRASVYAIFDSEGSLQHLGVSRNAQQSLRAHFARRPELCGAFATFHICKPDRTLLEAAKEAWFAELGIPPGNDAGPEQAAWEGPVNVCSADEVKALGDEAIQDKVRQIEEDMVQAYQATGCLELLSFDPKLKARGLLDLDVNAPMGIARPADGVELAYKVTLVTPDGPQEFDCPLDMTILEGAEQADIELPCACKAGGCSTCAGRVVAGTIDQTDQSFLDDEQVAAGYCLTCVAYPRSDLTLETDKASDVA